MEQATFILNDETNEWQYKDIIIIQDKDDRWRMGKKKLKLYDSIYHVINTFQKRFMLHPVFKLPRNMDDIPSALG